jgi:beta-fructofuranosidase
MVIGPDGKFSNFYTSTNESLEKGAIQRIGRAVGSDPFSFEKTDLVLEADESLYERLDKNAIEQSKATNQWKEEAWRDPWVFFDARDSLWHMLITARLKTGASKNRGTVGHAVSADLENWKVLSPLTENTPFAHMEVFQVIETKAGWVLVFSTGAGDIDPESGIPAVTGTYSAPADSPTGPFHLNNAELVDDGTHYAGRVIADSEGRLVLLGFQNGGEFGFTGVIGDPVPLLVTERGTIKKI